MKIYSLIATLIIFASFIMNGCSSKNSAATGYRQISAQEAMTIMEKERGYIILDVRTKEEYDAGHIAGAVNVPLQSITDGKIAALADKNQLILVYCRSGNRSKAASEKLAANGYTNIVEFGGINQWSGKIEKIV